MQALDHPVWRTHITPYAAELLPRAAEIAREVTDAIHNRVPEVGGNSALASATLASAEANIALILTMIRDGVDPDVGVEPPAAAVSQARHYAVSGSDVVSLQRTYRVGHERFWAIFLDPLPQRISDNATLAEAVSISSRFVFTYVDAVSMRLVSIFNAERDRWLRSSAATRADTVRSILAGTPTDASAASRQLHYDLDRAHLGFLIWSEPTEQDVLGLLEERAARLAAALGARSSLLAPLDRFTVAGWISTARPLPVPDDLSVGSDTLDIRATVGSIGRGLQGFRASHNQAWHARRVVELAGLPAGHVEQYARVALLALTTQDLPLAHSFIDEQLGPLGDGSAASQRLAKTLAVFLAEGSSPARAAKRLGVHENTVANRISRIEKLLGKPIEPRRLELGLALRIKSALVDKTF